MGERFVAWRDTPIGKVRLVATRDALVELLLPGKGAGESPAGARGAVPPVLDRAARELDQYFLGRRRDFTVPLEPSFGTGFQRAVWAALREIPYGETVSYAVLASRAGRPAACRAAGGANGRNPLPIFVPCHRVVSSDGSIGGYSGGVAVKRFLLDLERRALSLPPFP